MSLDKFQWNSSNNSFNPYPVFSMILLSTCMEVDWLWRWGHLHDLCSYKREQRRVNRKIVLTKIKWFLLRIRCNQHLASNLTANRQMLKTYLLYTTLYQLESQLNKWFFILNFSYKQKISLLISNNSAWVKASNTKVAQSKCSLVLLDQNTW